MAQAFGKVRSRVQRDKRQWYLDFGRVGKVYSLKGEPFADCSEAESILRAIQGDVARGTPRQLAVEEWLPTASRANRVERWLGLWMEDLRARVAADERSGTYLRDLERWTKPGPHGHIARLGKLPIQSIDFQTIRDWQKEIPAKGKTLWNITAGLSAFLGWLVQVNALPSKPTIPWPRYDEHAPAIARPEVQDRIVASIPEAERGVFLAMAMLGLRHSEAWALDGTDYRDGRLWVRHARKGRRLSDPVRGTKNRLPRVLPVPHELAEWIDTYVPREVLIGGGSLFPNPRTGGAWSPTSFRRAWAKACGAAGLPVLKPYETLRHSTATEWMRRGASEREVQGLLGHKTSHATRHYARLADERLGDIVDWRDRERGPERKHSS
jgi:integrase